MENTKGSAMTPKVYHLIVFVVCTLLSLHFAACMLFPNVKWLGGSPLPGRIKDVLALFILFMQSCYASRFVQRANAVLSFFAILGILLAVQHWPFGRILFIGSFGISILLLFNDSLRQKTSRASNFVILLFPLSHLVMIGTKIICGVSALFFLDLFVLLVVAVVLGYRLFWK
jgi:hypothetical protein